MGTVKINHRRYKSVLCRFHESNKRCRNGGSCQYAHGKDEISKSNESRSKVHQNNVSPPEHAAKSVTVVSSSTSEPINLIHNDTVMDSFEGTNNAVKSIFATLSANSLVASVTNTREDLATPSMTIDYIEKNSADTAIHVKEPANNTPSIIHVDSILHTADTEVNDGWSIKSSQASKRARQSRRLRTSIF